MKILHCDSCHVEVNDYAHWYNDAQPRNMYELKCVDESGSDTYNGMIICHKCIEKLLHKAESVTEFADRCRECGAKYGKLLKQKSGKWIPCSESLPEDLEPVNITWVNHNPRGYYADIKDKPFTATGHCCKGRWYWYSSTCQDYLGEYGRCDVDEIDTDIEVTAWMPLPEPYKAEGNEKE